jgi:hypothetical protein
MRPPIMRLTVMAAALTMGVLALDIGRASAGESRPLPGSLTLEHQEILRELGRFAEPASPTATVARSLLDVLEPHMQREEEFVYPPLVLLPAIAEGRITPDMNWAIPLADRVAAERATLFEEHSEIMGAVGELLSAASINGEDALLAFGHRVAAHALNEIEILEPAAILVGETLRSRLGND